MFVVWNVLGKWAKVLPAMAIFPAMPISVPPGPRISFSSDLILMDFLRLPVSNLRRPFPLLPSWSISNLEVDGTFSSLYIVTPQV